MDLSFVERSRPARGRDGFPVMPGAQGRGSLGQAMVAVLVSAAAVLAPPVAPRGTPSIMAETKRSVLVRGNVLDYGRRPAADALVSGAGGTGSVSVHTDDQGKFLIRVSAGTYLSAMKNDMLGSVIVGDA